MNNYKLSKVTLNNKTYYYAIFVDGSKKRQNVEISKEVYDIIKNSISKNNTYYRNCREVKLCSLDESLVASSEDTFDSDLFFQKYALATKTLTATELRRFEMCLWENKSNVEIAKIENVSQTAISKSIKKAKKKIKKSKIFKNL